MSARTPAGSSTTSRSVSRDTHFAGAVLSAAMSAIDIALWDILGKSVGKPVYQLLGGKCRDKVRVFANVGGETLDERGQERPAGGRRRATPRCGRCRSSTAGSSITPSKFLGRRRRDRPGDPRGGRLRDRPGRRDPPQLRPRTRRSCSATSWRPFRILYYEDPVAPESLEALRYVARHVNIPIATGERCYNLYQFKEMLDTGTVALIRPDLSLAGGFTQVKKIAALAEAAFVGIFPHLMGSPVNLAAYVQLDAAIPNYSLMESGSTA